MTKHTSETRMTRREMLAGLVALGLSLTGRGALAQGAPVAVAAPWPERFELAVTMLIVGSGRRPYVAVWLEDPAGKPVRTLRLWVQKQRRTWIRDLQRWFRLERERRAQGGNDLILAIAGATRQAGKYTVRWDGKDDAGKPVEQGSYFVCVESVRQGGTDHLIRQAFEFGTSPFQAKLEGSNPEISEVSIEYRQRAAV